MPRFLFFRHAQSYNNLVRTKLDQDWNGSIAHIRPLEARQRRPDPGLTEDGLRQSQNLARVLPQMCDGRTLVACSPFLRTLLTLEPSLPQLIHRQDVDVICHGLLYELGGCYHMSKTHSGLGQEDIARWIAVQKYVHIDGWFHGRTHRETKEEYVLRVQVVVQWIRSLLNSDYDTVVFLTHGAFMARVIRSLLSIPDEVWITHANTAYTSLLWDKEQGFLLEGINQKAHIPHDLQSGDTPADGWWPAIYKRETVFHALGSLPKKYPILFEEMKAARTYACSTEIEERSVFFIRFHHHTLCAWVQYDPHNQTQYERQQISGDADEEFDDFVVRGCSKLN